MKEIGETRQKDNWLYKDFEFAIKDAKEYGRVERYI